MKRKRYISKRVRFKVLQRDCFKCVYCGKESQSTVLHLDHVVPFSRGGKNTASNLVVSCADCNLGKGTSAIDGRKTDDKRKKYFERLVNDCRTVAAACWGNLPKWAQWDGSGFVTALEFSRIVGVPISTLKYRIEISERRGNPLLPIIGIEDDSSSRWSTKYYHYSRLLALCSPT